MSYPAKWPHILTMKWHDLAFLHWAVEPRVLAPHLPPGLQLDTFEGKAWLGLVPFRMSQVQPRGFPHWKWITDFPEMNVRTYASDGKVSGVWFFSLDATQPLAVWAARKFFHLPYFNASICCQWAEFRDNPWHYYSCQRTLQWGNRDPLTEFAGRYRPIEAPSLSLPGSLEYFLSERYWLFARSPRGQVYRPASITLPGLCKKPKWKFRNAATWPPLDWPTPWSPTRFTLPARWPSIPGPWRQSRRPWTCPSRDDPWKRFPKSAQTASLS